METYFLLVDDDNNSTVLLKEKVQRIKNNVYFWEYPVYDNHNGNSVHLRHKFNKWTNLF